MTQRPARESGFTLMELIIVLTLAAILSAAVIPVFGGTFRSVESDSAVREFVATLRYAQERAITDALEYRLYMNPDDQTYFVARRVPGEDGPRGEKVFEPLKERQGEALQLPERLVMRDPRAKKDRDYKMYYVAFYPNGACDEALITLERDDRRRVKVSTKGAIGRLEVESL